GRRGGAPGAAGPAAPAVAAPAVAEAGAGAAANGGRQVAAAARPGDGPDALDLAHITVRYGGHVALNDISLTAPVGRITGLIGPNGAGKTTLFNVASGLVRPVGGTLRLRGADMSALDPAARARHG